jgi:hypothetical protein
LEENFDRINSQFTKEKEMVNFRRFALAIPVLTLFAGMASAQVGGVGGGTPQSCQTNVSVTPALRGEGYTEQTGDVTLSCTGGNVLPAGATVPLVNITVFYNTTVTSRLITNTASSASEALLLIDEPGSGLLGFGPSLPQTLCPTPLSGCPATVGLTNNTITTGSVNPANVYQGIVSGNSVTFFGVPALPPGTQGTRVFRITNVRVNAVPLAGGAASGAQPVQASISISGATSLSLTQSSLAVGFVQSGLTATVSSAATTLQQCSSQTKVLVGFLNFAENFGTAFKTRVAPQTNTQFAGQIGNPGVNVPPYFSATNTPLIANQNTPGAIYNSESNFVLPLSTGGVAGLADYGTRLKAIFNNVPAGANIFVSVTNVVNSVLQVPAPALVGNNSISSYALLVSSETASDGNLAGFLPTVTATDNASGTGTAFLAQVPITAGTGTAVWEVVNTNPNAQETFSFAAYITFTANVPQSSPAAGTSTVNLSYAATATSGVASSTLTIPRFVSDGTAARTLFGINICRTILLYPYLTNQAGFDTGFTVANTSQDPFTVGSRVTAAQAGSCVFTWYGGTTAAATTPPAPTNTGNIAAGTVFAGLVSTLVPTFQGYAFAVCNFQYAHGFAFISDLGARNLAMGYLAVVIQDPGTGSRIASPSCQGIAGCPTAGEAGAH